MAAALLGKCIGLLALLVLFYSCCYAFRLRDGPPTQPTTNEQGQRAACDSIFGRCTDMTSTETSTARKWHEQSTHRSTTARKPPVDVTSFEDDDHAGTRGGRAKSEKIGHPRDTSSTRTSKVKSAVEVLHDNDDDVDDHEDDDDVIVEVVDASVEEVDDELVEDSGVDTDNDEDGGDQDPSDIDDDDDDDEKEDYKSKSKRKHGNQFPEKKDLRVSPKAFRGTITKKDIDEEEGEEDDDKTNKKVDKDVKKPVVKIISSKKREKVEVRFHKTGSDKRDESKDEGISVEEDENDSEGSEGEAVEDDEGDDNEIDSDDKKDEDDDKNEDDDEDENEDEDTGKDDDEDEDEDDDEEEDEDEAPKATPPPRKLEKVRLADKDKVKPVQIATTQSFTKKPGPDVKPSPQTTRKQEDTPKKPIDTSKKAPENTKKPTEGIGKPVESKKGESPKITKPEPQTPKTKSTSKPEEKTKVVVTTEPSKGTSKTKDQAKDSPKATVNKVDVKSTSAKPVGTSRTDKKDTKTKRDVHALSLAELNDAILRVPTFVPNFTAIENPECQQHGKIFIRQLRGYKLWALQMLDSSAKVPSGLLRGNTNQFGDFDQCLGVLAHVKVEEKTIKIQGKYCLANIDFYASHPDMKFPVHLMQSRAFIRGSMRDPGHFVPKFTTMNWALCLPAACSAEDAENVLEHALSDYNVTAGIKFTVDVNSDMCYVKQKARTYSKETIGVLYFYAMIICLAVVATVRDYLVVSEGKGNYSERIIMSFSLRRTMKALFREGSGEDITCIHGIRALVTFILYVAHQLIPITRLPFANRVSLTEIANHPISSFLRASAVYTDAFLVLSGVLTAYNMAKEYTKRGEIRWFCRFIARYIRLTPALLAVVFWYAFVMEHTGSGPQWNSVILSNSELCKNNAWTNLLYIQNFFPFEEMCATHTYQLALDMQLSLIAPMLVFFLECRPVIGILLISFFTLLSATLRYIVTTGNNLSIVIYHGMSLKHLYKTANLTYSLPLHRATPYVFGIGLGVLLHYVGKNVRVHKVLMVLGWLIAMALGSWSLFSPWRLAKRDYVYNVEEAAHYAVISPVAWALALCWCIFACFTNNGGIFNRFLSSYWLVIFSRLSYAIYLTQFAVFFYNVGTTRYTMEFQLHRAIDPLEIITVIVVSIAVTLLFDLPMQEVKSVIMESTDVQSSNVSSEEKSIADDKDISGQKNTEDELVREKVFEDDEVASTGWDWQKDIIQGGRKSFNESVEDEEQVVMPLLKKIDERRKSFIAPTSKDDEDSSDWVRESDRQLLKTENEYMERGRISRNSQRDYSYDSEEEILEYFRVQQQREEAAKRTRRSVSKSRDGGGLSARETGEDEEYYRRKEERDDSRQSRRSQSRSRSVARDPEDYRSWEFIGKERPPSRGSETRSAAPMKLDEYDSVPRQIRPPLVRSGDVKRAISSESEEDSAHRRKFDRKHMPVELKISDEEEWESELRERRKQFMEKLAIEGRDLVEDQENQGTTRRRSSAEGKLALLKDPSAGDNLDPWAASFGTRVGQLGSSQEPSEPEDEDAAHRYRREYRESAPPPREETRDQSEEEAAGDSSRTQSYTSSSQVTSMEEDEDVSSYNFVLTKDSKRISLQDLSKLSQDDIDLSDSGWNVVKKEAVDGTAPKATSLGLYKRESIIKSQASEEDPEYILPERPKLIQQEREHPFKKAWQMQKSRSEEDGSALYAIKEPKEQLVEIKVKDDDSSAVQHQSSAEQSEDVEGSLADDESESITLSQSRSSDTDGTKVSSKSSTDELEPESTSAEHSKSPSFEERGNAVSDAEEESPSEFNWPNEDEQFATYKITLRRKSEETEWKWEQET